MLGQLGLESLEGDAAAVVAGRGGVVEEGPRASKENAFRDMATTVRHEHELISKIL